MKDRLARLSHVVRRELRATALKDQQRKLEREVRHLQRIEALGALAGGIAHNFRNVLMAVRGLGELASAKLPEHHPAAADLTQLLEATGRSEQLVDKILRFSRSEALAPEVIDLHAVVTNAIALLRPTLPAQLQLNFDGRRCMSCCASAQEVEQMILNLCNNAAQAIGQRAGTISLLLDKHCASSTGASLLAPGNYCRLRVIDDGPGMAEEVRARIFEPFFTTKPAGEGTGLGLAMVQRAMSELGGAVACTSEVGHGTTFELFFPEALSASVSKSETELVVPQLGQGERVLLVDDEQLLANIAAAFLSQAGYKVTKFYDPASALGAFRSHAYDYDLLLTDLAMPGMTGVDLAAEMRALRPELPVVLCTGYGGDPGGAMHKHCDVIVGKPCGRVELYNAVRTALELPRPVPVVAGGEGERSFLDFGASA
jgi:nitrogen-specific signal transduction histidine kinase